MRNCRTKERKINKRMKTERKGKSRQFKLMIWKTIDEMICRAILEIQSVKLLQQETEETKIQIGQMKQQMHM